MENKFNPIHGVKVIGVGHKARQGKDTIAGHLVRNYGATRMSFADALYDVARVVFGMKEKDGPLLQVLGTDVFRKKDPEIWLSTLYFKIQDQKPALVVIPDVRFPNEVEMIKSMGGDTIKIERTHKDGSPFRATDRPLNHPSEIALDDYKDWDYVITAKSGDLDDIYGETDAIMDWIK